MDSAVVLCMMRIIINFRSSQGQEQVGSCHGVFLGFVTLVAVDSEHTFDSMGQADVRVGGIASLERALLRAEMRP